MVVEVYNLTDELKEKLARIPDEFREKAPPGAPPNDTTRLCNKWRGALKEDKDMLYTLLPSNPKLTPKLLTKPTTLPSEFTPYLHSNLPLATGKGSRRGR